MHSFKKERKKERKAFPAHSRYYASKNPTRRKSEGFVQPCMKEIP
jgi:hypothetical protein